MFTILEIDGWTDGWIDRYNHLFSYGILSNENIQTIKICEINVMVYFQPGE